MKSGSNEKNSVRFATILATTSFLLISFAILSAYETPMTGYEMSVYEETPPIFWIALIIGLMNGIFLFVRYYGKNKRLWATGLFEIILCNFLLISLYVYRGSFYLERTDSLSYIGYAKDVLIQGTIPQTNFYPISSILIASTGDVINQSIISISQFLPAIFYSIFTISILCWAISLSREPRFVSSMMLASMPILFAWFIPTLMHETLCVLMLPLLFYSLRKGRGGQTRFKILTGILIVFFTLGHPLVAIGVLLFLIIIALVEYYIKSDVRTISNSMIMFAFVVPLGWIAMQASLVHDLRAIAEQMIGLMGGASTFGNASEMASKLGIWSTIQSIAVCCIDDFIYIILTLWVGLILLKHKFRPRSFTTIVACFLGGSVFLAALVFMTFTHNLFRLINLNFIMIFAIPSIGFLLCYKKQLGKVMVSRIITCLVIFCMIVTVFAIYQDQIDLFPNGSITRSEVTGSNWLISDHADQIGIYEIQTVPWRYADLIYGASYNLKNPDLRDNETMLSDHFGSFFAPNSTDGTAYLVLSAYDEVAYTQTWQAVDRFNTNDFQSIAISNAIDRLYDTAGFAIYSRS